MAKFIRLQKKQYDIDENSMSYPWEFGDSVYGAMWEFIGYEVEVKGIGSDNPLGERYYNILEVEDIYDALKEDKELQEEVEMLWNDMGQPGLILNGVSCYGFDEDEEAAARELLEYFQLRDPAALEDNDYYVLIFDGKPVPENGHNGEDVAIWQKDIERVPTKEFFSRYGLEV